MKTRGQRPSADDGHDDDSIMIGNNGAPCHCGRRCSFEAPAQNGQLIAGPLIGEIIGATSRGSSANEHHKYNVADDKSNLSP